MRGTGVGERLCVGGKDRIREILKEENSSRRSYMSCPKESVTAEGSGKPERESESPLPQESHCCWCSDSCSKIHLLLLGLRAGSLREKNPPHFFTKWSEGGDGSAAGCHKASFQLLVYPKEGIESLLSSDILKRKGLLNSKFFTNTGKRENLFESHGGAGSRHPLVDLVWIKPFCVLKPPSFNMVLSLLILAKGSEPMDAPGCTYMAAHQPPTLPAE